MKAYYCRTTHNFNNDTREWEYRDLESWNSYVGCTDYSLGIHGFPPSWEPDWRIISDILNQIKNEIEEGGDVVPKNLEMLVSEQFSKDVRQFLEKDMIRVKYV